MTSSIKKKVSFENQVWVLLTIILIVVTVSGFFVYKNLSKIVNEIAEEARPDETIILMKELLYDISEAENNVKSYSLTKETPYLERFNNKFSEVTNKIDRLTVLTTDQDTKNNIDTLEKLLEKKFIILEDLLILQSQYRVDQALDKLVTGIKINDKPVNDKSTNDKSVKQNVVEDKVTTVEPVSDAVEEERFFKKLINKRKTKNSKEEEEVVVTNTSETINTHESNETPETEKPVNENVILQQVNKKIEQVKYEEKIIDQSSREQELFLIQEDKKIMDQVMTIFKKMEEDETLSMEEKLAFADAQSVQTKGLIAVFCILACVLLFFAGYAVNTYVKKNDAFKRALRKAKQETDQKNSEITDSIIYAQRIQEAILPDMAKMKSYLKDSFILYKPKDIVAGDFYWMVKTDKIVFFAVADCTGHGVPGAMVSVVCNNALNRSVREFGLTKPSKILEKCRDLVIETFAAGNHNVNDGMDIALVSLEMVNEGGEEKAKIEYAGANNPLYIIKNKIIQEIVADKQPIGKYQNQQPFTNHQLILDKGDVLYLFSDGMADQFGGPKGKKFKYKPFQDLLISNSLNEMELQKRNIDFAFENWRGDLEQVDDICIIGVRL